VSHFTKIRTKLRDEQFVRKALERMGISFQEGSFTITAEGQNADAQFKLDKQVGLARQKDGTFAMVGDFYYSRNQNLKQYYYDNKKFNTDLSTAYAIEEDKYNFEEQSFHCTENVDGEIGEDGLIHMTYERW